MSLSTSCQLLPALIFSNLFRVIVRVIQDNCASAGKILKRDTGKTIVSKQRSLAQVQLLLKAVGMQKAPWKTKCFFKKYLFWWKQSVQYFLVCFLCSCFQHFFCYECLFLALLKRLLLLANFLISRTVTRLSLELEVQ